jgi:hypothetical protein
MVELQPSKLATRVRFPPPALGPVAATHASTRATSASTQQIPASAQQLADAVDWEHDVPAGGMFHIATFDDEGAHIVDLWESQEAFERFGEERLMAAVRAAGIEGDPEVVFRPTHAVFAPAYETARA